MTQVPNRPAAQSKYPFQYMGNSSFDEDFGINAVEILGYDGKKLQRISASFMSIRIEYDGSSNPIYFAVASPGVADTDPYWQVKKLTFDGSGNLTSLTFAGGTPDFNSAWSDRASLTYS